ncbi:MAG: hypothetical protein ACYCTF_12535 [Acidiferrobacter sp.]
MAYPYLNGLQFRYRMEAIAEAFPSMQEDPDKEHNLIIKWWAERGGQVERVMRAAVGI